MRSLGLAMKLASYGDDLPRDDNPIIATEETARGWRGLTAKGEILDVRSRNGHRAAMPDEDVVIVRGNVAVSRRPVERAELRIDDYLAHYNGAVALARQDRNAEALVEFERAIELAPTLFARFNRALILLALGRWPEGFAEYRDCEEHAPFMRPPVAAALAAGLKPWRGEDLAGKPVQLLHAHGFGDSIMALRYVPVLWAMGIRTVLQVPSELQRLAAPFMPWSDPASAFFSAPEFFCPLLHLLGALGVTPDHVEPAPYLPTNADAVERWRERFGAGPHVGIAWSPGAQPTTGDYPRAIPLDRLVAALGDAQLHSIQKQGADEAQALGVRVHGFADFSDCAAAMLAMDRIISVDTAALHLAGAIGHPRVDGLLSYWASWRWLAPWYANVRLCRQSSDGDWDSALAQMS
jgi:hypothetical protein